MKVVVNSVSKDGTKNISIVLNDNTKCSAKYKRISSYDDTIYMELTLLIDSTIYKFYDFCINYCSFDKACKMQNISDNNDNMLYKKYGISYQNIEKVIRYMSVGDIYDDGVKNAVSA